MSNLDRREGLDEQLRVERAESREQIEIPIPLQRRVQPADHVNLGDAERQRRAHFLDDLIDGELEGVRVAFPGAERAELAGEHAEVRVVDVLIVNVSRDVPVLPLADRVGHGAKRVQIVRAVERFALRVSHALTGDDFVEDGPEGRRDELRGDGHFAFSESILTNMNARRVLQDAFAARARAGMIPGFDE